MPGLRSSRGSGQKKPISPDDASHRKLERDRPSLAPQKSYRTVLEQEIIQAWLTTLMLGLGALHHSCRRILLGVFARTGTTPRDHGVFPLWSTIGNGPAAQGTRRAAQVHSAFVSARVILEPLWSLGARLGP
jgi:hypothetical protein